MSERDEPSPLNDLAARLKKLKGEVAEQKGTAERPGDARSGLALAMRVGVELVAALAVGVGIGLLLDWWLGTTPWLMVLFLVIGFAAGLMNVYRLMMGLDQSVGYRRGRGDDET